MPFEVHHLDWVEEKHLGFKLCKAGIDHRTLTGSPLVYSSLRKNVFAWPCHQAGKVELKDIVLSVWGN